MRWSRCTRSRSPSTGPMHANTAGQASPTSASGTACSCGSATASPRRVRAGVVTPMWSATRSGDQVAWATAVPASSTSGRDPPAVSASRAPVASVADSSEITGSRPLVTPDRSRRRRRAPRESGTSSTAASLPSGTSVKGMPSRRCSGFGTTRPAHTTSGEADAASSGVVSAPTVLRLVAAMGETPIPERVSTIAASNRSSRSATGSSLTVIPPTDTGPGMAITWSAP